MSIRTYFAVFIVLVGSTALELMLIGQPIPRDILTGSIVGLAGVKAVLIALFFQHLKDEPRPLSGLALAGLVGAAMLIGVSLLSVTQM